MTRVVFRNASVWDGSGAAAFPADVLVDGGRIRTIARAKSQHGRTGCRRGAARRRSA